MLLRARLARGLEVVILVSEQDLARLGRPLRARPALEPVPVHAEQGTHTLPRVGHDVPTEVSAEEPVGERELVAGRVARVVVRDAQQLAEEEHLGVDGALDVRVPCQDLLEHLLPHALEAPDGAPLERHHLARPRVCGGGRFAGRGVDRVDEPGLAEVLERPRAARKVLTDRRLDRGQRERL